MFSTEGSTEVPAEVVSSKTLSGGRKRRVDDDAQDLDD